MGKPRGNNMPAKIKAISDRILIVSNCHECPFVNNDNEYGKDNCNLDNNIFAKNRMELPSDKVHDDCPLKKGEYVVSLKK